MKKPKELLKIAEKYLTAKKMLRRNSRLSLATKRLAEKTISVIIPAKLHSTYNCTVDSELFQSALKEVRERKEAKKETPPPLAVLANAKSLVLKGAGRLWC